VKIFIADTNVFLRFLTNDVPEQAERIERWFREAEKGKARFVVLQITAVEILFQLEHWYRFSRSQAVDKLISLFSPSWLEIEDKEAILTALNFYKDFQIDFVDILTWSIAKKRHLSILSFDKDYDKLPAKLRQTP